MKSKCNLKIQSWEVSYILINVHKNAQFNAFPEFYSTLFQIIFYNLLGLWLQTLPVNQNEWYKTLTSTLNIEAVVENVKDSVDSVLRYNNACLTFGKTTNGKPSFQFNSIECSDKRSVVCRRTYLSSTEVSKPSRFPCMAKSASEAKAIERTKRFVPVSKNGKISEKE